MKLKQIQLANKVKIPQDLLSFLIDHRRIETNIIIHQYIEKLFYEIDAQTESHGILTIGY